MGLKDSKRAAAVVLGASTLIGSVISALSASPAIAATKNVVTIAEPAITTLDPNGWGNQWALDQGTIMEGLFGYDKNDHVVPKIATRWQSSDGGRVWTVWLRHDVKWSNGKPLNANDFYQSWLRNAKWEGSAGSLWESFFQFVVNGTNYGLGLVPASQVGLKVVNPYELQITLAYPRNLPGLLTTAPAMPLYMPVVNKQPTKWFLPQYFVGDGPYVVKSFTPNGNIVLQKNLYYKGTVGNVDEIDIVPQSTTPVETYMSGKVDVTLFSSPSDYRYVQRNGTLSSQLTKLTTWNFNSLAFTRSLQGSALDNLLVRKAIAEAIDRSVLEKVMNGTVQASGVFGPPGYPMYSLQKPIPYNVADAQKLLAKAGYPGGKGIGTLTMYVGVNDVNLPAYEAIVQQVKQNLGIDLQIEPTPLSVLGTFQWGPSQLNVKPGYMPSQSPPMWWDGSGLVDEMSYYSAYNDFPLWWRQYAAARNLPKSNPFSVKLYGDPNNKNLGVKWSDWAKLQAAFNKDNTYLNKYFASIKDPDLRYLLVPAPSYQTTWDEYVAQWKSAKTPADKHAAWAAAWNFVGGTGAGGPASGGTELDLLVWQYQHLPADKLKEYIDWAHEDFAYTNQQLISATAKLDQDVINSAYMVPLYAPYALYLTKPWVHGVVYDQWEFGNYFYLLQYLNVSPH